MTSASPLAAPLRSRPAAAARPCRRGRLAAFALAPLVVLASLGVAAERLPPPALVNETHSLPRGLYLRRPGAPPRTGAVVAARQPARARGYLARLGVPSDMALLKRVAAGPGEQVCADGRTVRAAAGFAAVFPPARRAGMPGPWRGYRVLGPDEYFLLGDTPWSYDSRYFGPVGAEDLQGVYRAVLTW
jgi:type IV secretory pathway protease TraF